ncbi:MarR family transcriptional regulator [Kribbella sandramycini]|uniref:MarR family transcriptional regulator n=1 Tax=Kribbella sandramycini TaxID=60450 RepID=A0A7Y4L2Z8_9ACTN|nr:MarR family transcriptional regulator [Kribbella sandramycini]MBB6564567.1 DNA-binding MarR family transcriptional regulator [Kribbella sandramycini]NOL42271.1 MarR family transcriptional regulator [Kribbella sandramycini]
MTRWLTADEEQAWRAVRRFLTVLPSRLARDLNQLGLSSADYEVLSTLSEQPDHRWGLRDFAVKMQWSRSRLSHHAGRMEARGLITREPDPADARGSIYHLTDAGLELLRQAAPGHLDSVRERFVDHLTPAELATLGRLAERIADLPD